MRRAAMHTATTKRLIRIQIPRPMTIQVGTPVFVAIRTRFVSPSSGEGPSPYCPRAPSTYGTVRRRIFTSVHSDQLAT
jgi:hypothetical protein